MSSTGNCVRLLNCSACNGADCAVLHSSHLSASSQPIVTCLLAFLIAAALLGQPVKAPVSLWPIAFSSHVLVLAL